jgi:hypothetical protein
MRPYTAPFIALSHSRVTHFQAEPSKKEPWFKQKPNTFVSNLRAEVFFPEHSRFRFPYNHHRSAHTVAEIKQLKIDMLLAEKKLELLTRDILKCISPHPQLNKLILQAYEGLISKPGHREYHLSWPTRLQHFSLKRIDHPPLDNAPLNTLAKPLPSPLFILEYDSGKRDKAASRLQIPVFFEEDTMHPCRKRMVMPGQVSQLPWPGNCIQVIPSEETLSRLSGEGHQTMFIALSLPEQPYAYKGEDWKGWNRIPPEKSGKIIDLGVTRPGELLKSAADLMNEVKQMLSQHH